VWAPAQLGCARLKTLRSGPRSASRSAQGKLAQIFLCSRRLRPAPTAATANFGSSEPICPDVGPQGRLGFSRAFACQTVLTGQCRYRRCIISFASVIRFVERMAAFVSRKSKSKTGIGGPNVPGRVQRLALFGPPPLLEGEDAATYDQILAHICVAVKPVDIIDEMHIADAVYSQWEVLRYHRLKRSLIQARGLELLRSFLAEHLDYNLYLEHFADDLAEILRDNLPEDQADSAQTLACKCARNETDAVEKVTQVLARIPLMNIDIVRRDARARKAEELVQEYVRREPDAVTLIHELLTGAGKSMEAFMADALAEKLDDIVSGVLPPSCGGRRSSEDANGVDRIGSHIWSTI
jgi:hypothetical protein